MKIGFARHFLELKHGIAAICVSGVPYVAPFSSLINKNTQSLFYYARLLK
jgi:hypothetical protein